jgi:hypothetical protein
METWDIDGTVWRRGTHQIGKSCRNSVSCTWEASSARIANEI